jgi:protease I
MELNGKRIAVLVGENFQDQEAMEPMEFLGNEGADLTVVGIGKGQVQGLYGATVEVQKTFEEVDPVQFDAIFIPGGRSPAYLRQFPQAVDFVKSFAQTGRLIAAICHAGQLLAAAGLVKGLKLTGYPGIKEEMEEAGANFIDQPVVVDRNIVSSRLPQDIPQFNQKVKELLLQMQKSPAA